MAALLEMPVINPRLGWAVDEMLGST